MWTVNKLCRIFDIQHPLDQSTCIGFGTKKPTCGCAVAETSRDRAVTGILDICASLDRGRSSRSSLLPMLETTARLLHCKRWHQWQAEEEAQEWYDRLQIYLEDKRDGQSRQQRHSPTQRSSTRSHRATSSQRSSPPRSTPSLSAATDEDLLAELDRRLQIKEQILESFTDFCNSVRARLDAMNELHEDRGGVRTDSETDYDTEDHSDTESEPEIEDHSDTESEPDTEDPSDTDSEPDAQDDHDSHGYDTESLISNDSDRGFLSTSIFVTARPRPIHLIQIKIKRSIVFFKTSPHALCVFHLCNRPGLRHLPLSTCRTGRLHVAVYDVPQCDSPRVLCCMDGELS